MRIARIWMPVALAGALALAGSALSLAGGKDLQSGVQKGGMLAAFHPTHIAGPDKNTDTCPVCKYPTNPAVQVWINNDDIENVSAIAETLDKTVRANAAKKMKAFIIFVTPDDTSSSTMTEELKQLAADKKLENVALAYLPNPKHEAVKEYQINIAPEVKNTIFVYKDRKVLDKFVNLKADGEGLTALKTSLRTALGVEVPRGEHGPIAWEESFEDAQKMAARDKKLVMVDFYADWCGPCKQMLKTTYQDSRVVKRSTQFVPLLVDVDKHPKLAEKYGVEGIPTVLFLNAKGKVVLQSIGYVDATEFLKLMDKAVKKSKS